MCGIAGIYLKNKKAGDDNGMSEFANALLTEIEPRGRHATGFVSVGWDKSTKLDKSDCPASEFIKEREPFQKGVQAVLLHTRFATKGKPEVIGNNHPVIYNTCFAVHNGHVNNDDDLFKSEELKRNNEVDSEIIPALLYKHGMDTPDSIRAALEKIQGYMAIAAIDPVRNPTRLLLARGENSPLYIYENKNVIIWASTHSAIREAWGNVIGTPPHGSKIKFTPEGTFFIAEDYQELGKYEFKPKKRPVYTPTSRPTSRVWNRAKKDVRPVPWDLQGSFNTRKDFDDALKAYRASDNRVARHWGARESYDDKTDFADVKGCLTWLNCLCGRSVLQEDMITHLKYGSICIDCSAVIAEKYKAKVDADIAEQKKEREESDPLGGIKIPSLSDEDRNNLESWAFTEARIHRFTLNDLSDITGFSTQALDYLLFRTVAVAGDFGVRMLAVKAALQKAYQHLEISIHENYSEEVADTVSYERDITVESAQEIAHGMFYPWTAFSERPKGSDVAFVKYACDDHGETFFFGEHCYECQEEGDVPDMDYAKEGRGSEDRWPGEGGESSCGVQAFEDVDVTQCTECGAWGVPDVPCVPCSRETKAIEAPKVTKCCCKASRDRKCRRNVKLVVTNSLIAKTLGYCAQHWNKCSNGKCNADANFTALDGQRYCHKHSRGVQGIADAATNKGSNTLAIEEVK